ncbi:hypothetical protein [Flintibacter muris]|uniref:hypothetical protein n=1 Tax=Flintibacter muris TaxID=2941327 RepID=UPI00203E8A77|nr:hypothetical protein [Flintibacter muris]
MSRQGTTVFASLGGVRRCGGKTFFDKYLSTFCRMAASSYVPPVDIKMAALNNQNRRWKERLDTGNRPAQQRFFLFCRWADHLL